MLRRVAIVRRDVSEELSASFIKVTRIGELGTTLAVTSNRHKTNSCDRGKFSLELMKDLTAKEQLITALISEKLRTLELSPQKLLYCAMFMSPVNKIIPSFETLSVSNQLACLLYYSLSIHYQIRKVCQIS
jgi:hypothetical protein